MLLASPKLGPEKHLRLLLDGLASMDFVEIGRSIVVISRDDSLDPLHIVGWDMDVTDPGWVFVVAAPG